MGGIRFINYLSLIFKQRVKVECYRINFDDVRKTRKMEWLNGGGKGKYRQTSTNA